MVDHTRRGFLGAALASSTAAAFLTPVQALAKDKGVVRITNIDIFNISIPTPQEMLDRGVINSYTVAAVDTDAGVRGYSFAGPPPKLLERTIRPTLVGKDLFAIDDHLKAGLIDWGGLEHALWDAVGKIAGEPVYRLLGGSKSAITVYLTCVWRGKEDQSEVPYHAQAEMAARIQKAGFKGMKIRAWRPNPLDDVAACAEVRKAVGPDFCLMFDRTAHFPGKVWDYDTALEVARGLEKHHAYWLEEPFDRYDFLSPARLARDVHILITGGEGYRGLDAYREVVTQNSLDILQPDARNVGGILTVRKVAALAEAFHKRVILHGTMGLSLAGWLQASAAIGAEWQELALITPPLLPEEEWSPALKVLNSKTVFDFQDGQIQLPERPGLGLDINEEALRRYRLNS